MGYDNGKPADFGDGQANRPISKPIRREHYLSRFGSAATLMTVEFFTAEDGTEKKRSRFCRWPGL
jgi:hypothetical protein